MILVPQEKIERYTERGWWGTRTLDDCFRANVAAYPQRQAVVDAANRSDFTDGVARSLSYAALDDQVARMAQVLLDHGLMKDDIVVVQLPNGVEQFVIYLACVAAGAGGHTGSLTPFAFIPAVREFFDGFIIIGGGIADGAGIYAARTVGADLVYMGTRFIPSDESMAEPAYKQMIVDCDADDLLVSAAITGSRASWLKPSLAANGLDPDKLPEAPRRDYNSNSDFKDKRWLSVWAAGQGVGASRAVQAVAQIVDELVQGYGAARRRARDIA